VSIKALLTRREVVPAALVIVAFIAGVIESPYFLDFKYLLDSSSLYAETGLLALGMTLVIIAGHIDLSVASILALVACLDALMLAKGWPIPVALIAGIGIGALLGYLNGLLIGRLKLPSFLVTLSTMAAYRGIAQVLLGAHSATIPPSLIGVQYLKIGGWVPWLLLFVLVCAVKIGLILHRTVLGRWIYTVGTNEQASRFAGVPTAKVTALVFTMSGAMAGLAALVMNSRLGVARFDDARGLELDVITVVVLGGTSITGGSGTILGSMLALLLIGLIRTGMGLANVTAEYQLAAVGTLLVLAVVASNLASRKSVRR